MSAPRVSWVLLCLPLVIGILIWASPLANVQGPAGGWAISVAMHPDNPAVVYAALHGAGILMSRDGGAHWQEMNEGLTERTVIPILIAPGDPNTLYAGTESGIFKSLNAGRQWKEISAGLQCRNVWSLVGTAQLSKRIYAGTSGGGVYRSDDAGESWKPISTGLTNPAIWPMMLGASPDIVFAGTIGGGVYRTRNGGVRWDPVNVGLANRRVMALAREQGPAPAIYAGTADGVFKSIDEGDHWWRTSKDLDGQLVYSLRINATEHGTKIYAGSGTGVFESKDAGRSWSRLGPAASDAIIWSVAVSPLAPAKIYAGALGAGVLTSEDGGAHWKHAMADIHRQIVYALADDGQTIYAGTAGAGVMRSKDRGVTWVDSNDGLTKRVIKVLALSPKNPRTVYAGAEDQFMGGHGAIFKSVDGGASWKQVTGADFQRRVFSIVIDGDTAETVYSGTDGGHVYVSSDAGNSWRAIDHGYLAEQASRNSVYQQSIHPASVFALAISPGDPKTLFAATDAGIFKTGDMGETWTDASATLPDRRVRCLMVDPKNPNVLYAGSGDLGSGGGLFRTSDGGRTWSETSIRNEWVLSLAVDARDHSRIYAGTSTGVFQSTDGAGSFIPLRNDATSHYVLALGVSPDGNRVYGGTEGNGVFGVAIPR